MINVNVIDKPVNVVTKYPYLGYWESDLGYSAVVLFIKPNTGILLRNTDPGDMDLIGMLADNWAEDQYSPFTGILELSNMGGL